ncbi:hypothetical protein AOL_s00043g446 [Orbilia oligospora ATCC 24927]|uniref:Uncharacterized protein n=1 Tax=Arthrobotrys oligospora (strain ATCC 24927 / CBS 115.81 / DSM 1491) TaxID=756982 RepID=G1X422_ARTOA|nr:hypothetical protein AOL_s00043g446 [Orbilia oligospora ATCC 24927]EGX52056.1 hypothetical protein AOL_s00043g446 [Orbilia oligospora ATCC 24927]
MIRIRSKEDFFIGGTSPWLSQNRRRNRKQYIGTWQEQNQLQFLKGTGVPQLNTWVIENIENLEVKEARLKKSKPDDGALIDEADVPKPSPLAQYQVPEQSIDERQNGGVNTIIPPRAVSKQMRNENEEDLGIYLTLSPKEKDRNAINKACYENRSLPIHEEQDVEEEEINALQLSESLMESHRQSIGKPEGPENSQARLKNRSPFNDFNSIEGCFCNIEPHTPPTNQNPQSSPSSTKFSLTKNIHPSSSIQKHPWLSPRESEMPVTRAYKRAAEVAGVNFEEHVRADFQPKRIKVNDGQDNYNPPAATSKLEKKTQRPQRASMHRNQIKRTTYSPSMVHVQSDGVEGGDNGIEWAIALSNNLNLTYTHGTPPAAANEASSPINILSKPHSIMPRRQPKELLSSRQPAVPADVKATHQPATAASDMLPPSLSVSGTPENSQQQQARHLHSSERSTTISEITDEEEAKERKVLVPDRAAVQSLNRLFFTPRPERLLTREEMSRFLDPDLLPRFNPALRRPTKK